MIGRLVAAALIAAPLFWIAGEDHRSNCVREGRTSCSALPWNDGVKGGAKTAAPRLSRELQREIDAAGR